MTRAFLTGGTGFLGGHVARVLRERGHDVLALVRPTSDATQLQELGVTLRFGDITDQASIAAAAEGADIFIHGVARVGGFGPWDEFESVGVTGTANAIAAAEQVGARRFVHLGSIAVYGTNPAGRTYTESTPLEHKPEGWNHYVREKVEAEQILWEAHGYDRIAATSVRPSIVVGPGDRYFPERAIAAVNFRFASIVGSGNNYVPFVRVEDVAEAVVNAAEREETAGKAYNLSSRHRITQVEIMSIVTAALGRPPVRRKVSLPNAMRAATILEAWWRLARRPAEPPTSRFMVSLLGHQYQVDSTRAERDLDWTGDGDIAEGIRASLESYTRSTSD